MSITQFLKGLVIILIGVILLLNNLNLMDWSIWFNIFKLWPLLLISIGISLIFKRRLSWLGPLLLLLGVIFAIGTSYMGIDLQLVTDKIPIEVKTMQREIEMIPAKIHGIEEKVVTEENVEKEISESATETESKEEQELAVLEPIDQTDKNIEMIPSIQKARLFINYTVGSFLLKYSTPLVYQCQVSYRYPEFKPIEDFSIKDNEATILITHQPIPDKVVRNPRNQIDLKLNPDIVYDIFLETGATAIDYDLSKFKIENFTIKSGASKINIIVPQYDGTIKINSGVSKIDIAIPRDVGSVVSLDTGLSIKDFEQDFQKKENNLYISQNYNSATYHVTINIDSGISQIKVYYL